MIDFHSHLDLYPDPSALVKECIDRGVYILSVTTTPSAWKGTSALAPPESRIRTALGLHPQIAHQRKSELVLFDAYLPETKYVGEIGLDGAPEFKVHWDDQVTVFDHILQSSTRVCGRILSIHSRRATSAVLDRLGKFPQAGVPVLHWFTGNRRELDRAIAQKCWFSVGPAMLQSNKSCELINHIPHERILTESDGPFVQIDGRPAMPWDSQLAVAQLAFLWGKSPAEVEYQLRENLRRLIASI